MNELSLVKSNRLSVNARRKRVLKRNSVDTEVILSDLNGIMSDDELFKKTLIASGIYTKSLRLTKKYR